MVHIAKPKALPREGNQSLSQTGTNIQDLEAIPPDQGNVLADGKPILPSKTYQVVDEGEPPRDFGMLA